MQDFIRIVLYSGFSGITVFIGGVLSYLFNKKVNVPETKSEVNHFIVAFGGGILISAIALVLIPHGMENLSLLALIIAFLGGGIIFYAVDEKLKSSGSKMSQILAMMLDFFPEAIALGAVFATDQKTGILLAFFIGFQNLPEAFNSFQDLKTSGFSERKSLLILLFLSFAGIIGALIGHFFLQEQPQITSVLMVFASGGILYLIFQDIAPNVKLKNSGIPAIGAVLGFLIGIIGEKLI